MSAAHEVFPSRTADGSPAWRGCCRRCGLTTGRRSTPEAAEARLVEHDAEAHGPRYCDACGCGIDVRCSCFVVCAEHPAAKR